MRSNFLEIGNICQPIFRALPFLDHIFRKAEKKLEYQDQDATRRNSEEKTDSGRIDDE